MAETTQLYISHGPHFNTDVEGRTSNIEHAVPGIDTLFIEDRETPENKLKNWRTAPIVLFITAAWLTVLNRIGSKLKSDTEILNRIEERHSPEIVPVDRSIHTLIRENPRQWLVANWLPVFTAIYAYLFVVTVAPETDLVLNLVHAALVLLLSGAAVAGAMMGGFNTSRDLHMAKRIAEYTGDNEVNEAALICGSDHYQGIHELCNRVEGIEVVEE